MKYVSKESAYMDEYLIAHSKAQELRDAALVSKKLGPSIILTGAPNSGKTTVCKLLLNYALKHGCTPLFVDLDLDNNDLAPPGCIGAARVSGPLEVGGLTEETLSFFSGDMQDRVNSDLYVNQIKRLAELCFGRLNGELA